MSIKVGEQNFQEEVLNSDIPVLVDFWAEWCMPCKMVSPIIDEISEEYEGKIKVCKLNIDEAGSIASEYKVMSIPTLAIFKNGDVVSRLVGALPKDALIEKIEEVI